ncbi:MAG: hybrid sensor histidine kinase/response regulator [Elusimicrobiales bacterium]|nr:hybrid sensor histidine kinase/response regulator [Elusimicrobiales bacterium]
MNPGKILIVDDDANLRMTLRDLLEDSGYEIAEAESGGEAVKAVSAAFYPIILMDYNLTDKTGIEVIQDIRKINRESRILMMTAHASLDTAILAIQESVYDFLIKPVEFRDLLHAIRKAEENFRLEQENRQLVNALKQKNLELGRMNALKSRFMSMASHDLSNLLMTLQLSIEMLSMSLGADEGQKQKISFISESISRISRLVNDLVDWAAIEKGKFRLEKSCFNVQEALVSSLHGWESRAAMGGIKVKLDVEPGLPSLFADRRRLGQVIMNLVENSIRHTHSGGSITVKAYSDGGEMVFSVSDTGDGIDREGIEKLFNYEYQGAGGGKMGLGLTIAQEIAQAHGGRLKAESEGKGKGSVFYFILPLNTHTETAYHS